VLQRWRKEFRGGTSNAFPGNGKQRWSDCKLAELERKIGQQTLEIAFLKGLLQRIKEHVCEANSNRQTGRPEDQRMLQVLSGNPPSSGKSRKK
jgi:transposase